MSDIINFYQKKETEEIFNTLSRETQLYLKKEIRDYWRILVQNEKAKLHLRGNK